MALGIEQVQRREAGLGTGDLALSLPSALTDVLKPAADEVLKQYEAQIRRYQPWLEQKGRYAVRAAAARIVPLLAPKPGVEPAKPTGQPGWAERLYQPVLDPVMRGAEAEAQVVTRPLVTRVLLAVAAYTLAAVLVGRVTKRCG